MTLPRKDAAGLAHDFNNLLTAMMGAADAILARPGLDPETRADIQAIREGARRGGALTQNPPGTIGTIPIDSAIRQTVRLLARRLGAGIALDLDLAAADSPVRMESARLDSVLLNLAANARHAMPGGGTVTLRTRRRQVTEAETRAPDTIPPGDYVAVSFADTGRGIPAADLPRVFGPGFTTRRGRGGSGLGLASVRGIVHQAHGFLALDSEEGRGTRFEIYLPTEAAQALGVGEPCPEQSGAAGTLLMVEDEPLVLHVAARGLRRAGWTVLTAETADDALAILDRPDMVCDLMISDVSMPGMDGLALARRVRAQRPDMPVILTSGYDIPPLDDAGVTVLTKPYDQKRLLEAAVRAVRPRNPRASTSRSRGRAPTKTPTGRAD